MGIYVALFVQQRLDQFLVADDDGGVVISLQREKATIFLRPPGKPTEIT